ncbi:FecR family protein [Chitinophaga polysaccharea]|uniref:FecR family protein n=1 Tax=Chitinophaga TaxID=79328 RepID=UPI0014559B0C|nr:MULTISPECIES: FecR family protein [Chitinophaga]NLR62653.1 FecR family protein [Chitinophaga polysaccharea]NLU91457.1 FecR family protein [Chitinophaga sp. Ak27]
MKKNESLCKAPLIRKEINKRIMAEEQDLLPNCIADNIKNKRVSRKINSSGAPGNHLLMLKYYNTNLLTENIFRRIGLFLYFTDTFLEENRFNWLENMRRYWTWITSAVAVLFVCTVCFKVAGKPTPLITELALNGIKQKCPIPGSCKSILTLADGMQLVLANNSNDTVGQQGKSNVTHHKGGLFAYNAGNQPTGAITVFNTIVVPAGARYEVVLSDGTHVFLNSASSLKYPASFSDSKREVVLTGEGYFEVAHALSKDRKAKLPFIVKIGLPSGDGGKVNVLGTHLNIMAYANEKAAKITLVSGLADVHKGNSYVLVRPGQQAILSSNSNKLTVREVDLEEELAWRSGKFIFKHAEITAIMRQISRWYNVDIAYRGDMSGIRFSGNIMQKDNAAELFDILEADGRLHFTVTDNQVIVSRVSE